MAVTGSDLAAKSSGNTSEAACRVLMDWHAQVTLQQLADSVHVFGRDYIASRTPSAQALLLGDMQVWELEPGLQLYRTQVVDQCDIRTSNLLRPSLKLLVLLEGIAQVRYGRYGCQWQLLDARQGPCALLVNLAQEDCFMRQWQTGRPERKLLISCTPEWLQSKGLGAALPWLPQHLAQCRWSPSRRAVALAEQLHHAAQRGADPDALDKLAWQARVLDLLHEGLLQARLGMAVPPHGGSTFSAHPSGAPEAATVTGAEVANREAAQARTPRTLSVQLHRRLVALRSWIDSPACDGMTLADIARHAGMSVSSLQRHFPAVAHGQSVSAYLRAQRLQRACQALERDGIGVDQAAELAGYASVTHFAKAFRDAFGCAPSQWRAGA